MTQFVPGTGQRGPVVIAGMHRSGTSLVASLFAGAGLDVGSRLIGASRGNDRGHWEDLDIYEFHARALQANGLAAEGFACVEELSVPLGMRDAAAALVAAKAAGGGPWGWKEPRTTLFLDFWSELLPEAAFVFVFRRPWEVADSLFRRGDEAFAAHPAAAIRAWHHYNRRILDFCSRHRSRCVVAEVTQVVADPAALVAAVRDRFGIPLGEPPARYEPSLLVQDAGQARRILVESLLPESIDVYAGLRELAGLPVQHRSPSLRPPSPSVVEQAIVEWRRAAAAEAANRQLAAAHADAVAALRTAEAAAAAAVAEAREQATAEVERLESAAREAELRAEALIRSADARVAALTAEVDARSAEAAAAESLRHAAAEAEARWEQLDREKRAWEARCCEAERLKDELAAHVRRLLLRPEADDSAGARAA